MTVAAISPQQLRSLVEDKWQRDQDAFAVGLHVTTAWRGPAEVEFDFGKASVVRADTVFQVREELLNAERQNRRIILLTRLQRGDLGHDVIARLARCRLFPIDDWASLCALFRAKELDRSICDQAIAQALLENAPADGYPPVSAGILDAGTVWRAVSRHVFEMGESEPDLVGLLLWATSRSGSARYLNASDELKASVSKRLTGRLGDVADSVLRFIDSGASANALALAVVCQVIFGEGQDTTLDAAAARMEQYHANKPISRGVGRTLARAAQDAIADLERPEDHRIAQHHLQLADDLLRQFRCEDHAYRNRLTLLGYEQRLARLGEQIVSAIEAPSESAIQGCEELQQHIANHRLARVGRYQERALRAEMAVRLVRWLSRPSQFSPAFADLASFYLKELAFVDWARESICRGEEVPDLSTAYQQLDQVVFTRRSEFSLGFARALVDWTSVGSKFAGICGVEDVLAQVVARVAEANNRVLLIVLDGMSWAVCHELLDDIRREHWFEATLDESSLPPLPVIATVPSVTNFSRATLLSGKLTNGDQGLEKRNFEDHPALKACCDRKNPPVLFHKKEATEGMRGVVGDDLSRAIISDKNRVVGVVINAIDDFLSKGEQMPMLWTISRISPLGALLKLARDSGRVVILASDHGHVWHRQDARKLSSETGSRWRLNAGPVEEGELVVSGTRVRDGREGNAVIVPWTEAIYYERQHNGYHGGATPQEMVCPLVILRDKSSAYSGLVPCEYPKPEWWASAPTATATVEALSMSVPPKRRDTLFDDLPEEPEEPVRPAPAVQPVPAPPKDWIKRLLSSQAYKAQKAMIRRHAPDDAVVQSSLEALDASGGIMTPTAFAKAADLPLARLDPLIAQMKRLLNVDGYEILTLNRNENKVELNVARLKRQFDLD
jgi:PglZ domain